MGFVPTLHVICKARQINVTPRLHDLMQALKIQKVPTLEIPFASYVYV